jgi:hypothetical protein
MLLILMGAALMPHERYSFAMSEREESREAGLKKATPGLQKRG